MRIASLALFALAACQTPLPAEEEVPVHGETASVACNAGQVQDLIGQAATAGLGADALRRSGARALRWIQPGQAVTMDFRTDRLNINLDAQNRVERITCG